MSLPATWCKCVLLAGLVLFLAQSALAVSFVANSSTADYEDDFEDEIADHDDASTQPQAKGSEEIREFEKHLDRFLEWYYRRENEETQRVKAAATLSRRKAAAARDFPGQERDDDEEMMQSDQPVQQQSQVSSSEGASFYQTFSNLLGNASAGNDPLVSSDKTDADADYVRTARNRRDTDLDDRSKHMRIQDIKNIILHKTGRDNSSSSPPKTGGKDVVDLSSLNISQLLPHFQIGNDSAGILNDEFLTEKIRSYYPSCEIPRNTDQDVWKDENIMNLYFNVDHEPEDSSISIATATLRLYRLPRENATVSPATSSPPAVSESSADVSCENSSSDQEDRLIRISIYWYTKSLRRHRVKRRLSDSKVVSENNKWVELSVRPATRAWTRGRNLGLAVIVEDQEGAALKADRYFKGASCMQLQNQSQPLSSMRLDGPVNLSELMEALEQIQQQPCITTYHCSRR